MGIDPAGCSMTFWKQQKESWKTGSWEVLGRMGVKGMTGVSNTSKSSRSHSA